MSFDSEFAGRREYHFLIILQFVHIFIERKKVCVAYCRRLHRYSLLIDTVFSDERIASINASLIDSEFLTFFLCTNNKTFHFVIKIDINTNQTVCVKYMQ